MAAWGSTSIPSALRNWLCLAKYVVSAVHGSTLLFLMLLNQVTFWTQYPYIFAVSLIKISILLFYQSVFTTQRFRLATNVLGGVVLLWTIAFFFASVFQAWPISRNWNPEEPGTMIDEFAMYLALACTELVLDVVILTLPWTVIWGLHMKTNRKWLVSGVFTLGGLWVQAIVRSTENVLIRYTKCVCLKCLPYLLFPHHPHFRQRRFYLYVLFPLHSTRDSKSAHSPLRRHLQHLYLDRHWALHGRHLRLSPRTWPCLPRRSFTGKPHWQH